MCLALPTRVLKRDGENGRVDLGGAKMTVSLVMTPEAKVGDWVLVHAGFAIAELTEEDARETWRLFDEMLIAESATEEEGG